MGGGVETGGRDGGRTHERGDNECYGVREAKKEDEEVEDEGKGELDPNSRRSMDNGEQLEENDH